MNRRRFNVGERVALYLASGGRCVRCGVPLKRGFHSDHRLPWSAGGETDVINGDALCPSCNQTKGAMVRGPLIWQQQNLATYRVHTPSPEYAYLVRATTGSGKSYAAEMMIQHVMQVGHVDRAIIVVPTLTIQRTWANSFRFCDMLPFGNDESVWPDKGPDGRPIRAIVTTQASVSSQPRLYRRLSNEVPTIVGCDEAHHLGDERRYGKDYRTAFERVLYKFSLTGTPWRSDRDEIPFHHYDPATRIVIPDYTYSYTQALKDGVCPPVRFFLNNGEVRWIKKADGEVITVNFGDRLSEEDRARRLRIALMDPTWMRSILEKAHARLRQCRRQNPQAGGLILAMDQTHAEWILSIMRELKIHAEVAISKTPDAVDVIERFRESTTEWIIAVRMVAEGADIPRLGVLIYATNITTETFFWQAVGRLMRDALVMKYCFLPDDEVLVELAQKIMAEMNVPAADDEDPLARQVQAGQGGQATIFPSGPVRRVMRAWSPRASGLARNT